MHIKNILIPVDFSDFSDKALEYALYIAEKYSAKITLFHAVVLFQDDVGEEQRLQDYEEWVKRREETIRTQMNKNLHKAKKRGISVETAIGRGVNAADVILDFFNDKQFDLIIMGTHGRTGLKHMLMGSVSEKVVRLAPVPVLTIHRSIPDFRLKKILVPIDFSIHSKKTVDEALWMAKSFNASIEFIHVIEQDIHPSFYASGIESIFQIDKCLRDRVIDNLKEFIAEQLQGKIPVEFRVKEGKAHREIVDYAKENEIDLIVIATHGLSGLDYVLLGSTTEKVVRWSTSPVLTVKRQSD